MEPTGARRVCGAGLGGIRRAEVFTVESGHLVRRVAPKDGVPYERRCPLHAFEAVARAVAALGATPFVLDDLCSRAEVSRSFGLVAMVFLKARGRIVSAGCKHVAGGAFRLEDTVADYHALAEGALAHHA